jgi:hypothetical protein
MAKQTKETKKVETKAVATKKPVKETAVVDVAALAAKANAAKALDSANRAQDGVNVQFISLCQSLAKALDDESELFIDGVKVKDFYIQSKKIRLGPKLRVVPLAFVTVYTEYSGSGQTGKFLGIWHKEDALQFPLCPGHFFNREMPNGHELRPAHWVIVYMPDHPEIERAVISFKSTGNKVAKSWSKDVDARGGASCQLLYELSAKSVSNDQGKWFEVNFDFLNEVYTSDPFTVVEDFAEDVINRSLEYNEAFRNGSLVPRRNVGHIPKQAEAYDDDDDDDTPTF